MCKEKELTDEEYLAEVNKGNIEIKKEDIIMGNKDDSKEDDEPII